MQTLISCQEVIQNIFYADLDNSLHWFGNSELRKSIEKVLTLFAGNGIRFMNE